MTLSLRLCCDGKVIPLERERACLRDINGIARDEEDKMFLMLSFPRRSGSFCWLASLADPVHIRATINKLSIMSEIHDAIVSCKSTNNKRLRNPKLLVAIKVRNQILFVRNNPQAKELGFLEDPDMEGVPTESGIELLKWFIQQVKDDLASVEAEPLSTGPPVPTAQPPVAPLPQADPSAGPLEPLEQDDFDDNDKESDDDEDDMVTKRRRFLSLPSDHPLVVAGIKEFSSHERCERALWYPSRSSFKIIRKDKKEVVIRVRDLKNAGMVENRISQAVAEGNQFLDELDDCDD